MFLQLSFQRNVPPRVLQNVQAFLSIKTQLMAFTQIKGSKTLELNQRNVVIENVI